MSRLPAHVLAQRLDDIEAWPRWAPVSAVRRAGAEPGLPVREIRTGVLVVREAVVAHWPGRGQRYRLLSGLPLKNYEGRVMLTDANPGTSIEWEAQFDAPPLFAWFWRAAIRYVLRRYVHGLAR